MLPFISLFIFLRALVPQSDSPSFEVASVKLNQSGAGSWLVDCGTGMGVAGPGRCRATNAPLARLIANAYDIPVWAVYSHISGLPSWAGTERFDIEGKSGNLTASNTELQTMMRNLLKDRFKLMIHEDTKEEAGYALVAARGGPKLRPIGERKINGPVACGGQMTNALVFCLSGRLNQPIVDRTGITGRHDFNITLEALPLGGDILTGPAVSDMLQEQFGLRLQSQKVPMRFLVIDHVEKPSEN